MRRSAIVMAVAFLSISSVNADALLLHSFEDEAGLEALRLNSVQVASASEHATHGEKSLQVKYGVSDWPNVFFASPGAYESIDWQQFGAFAFDAYNAGPEPLRINVRIDDGAAANGAIHCRQTGVMLPPREQVTVALTISSEDLHMRGAPAADQGDVNGNFGSRELDLSHIIAFQFFLARPEGPHEVFIDNVRLLERKRLDGIVDRFGQYTGAQWPGKVYEESELAQRRDDESLALTNAPLPDDRDKWGGWAGGPQLEATGWFRVEKVDGKWWFVDPDGRLFWSAGIDGVRPQNWGPFSGRQHMFTWLPEEGDLLAEFGGKGASGINFYGINLYRKYGAEWVEPWLDITRRRMLAWGFNTIGNWSDARAYEKLRMPYTVPIHYGGCPTFVVGSKTIPDFYTDEWAASVESSIRSITETWRDDPYCIGYFVDNELAWGGWTETGRYSLAASALALPGDRKVKQVFLQLLKDRHETIARLNQAWGTGFASWDVMLADPVTLPDTYSETMSADLSMMLTHFAERYFSVVGALMDECAPNQLYLGPRFAAVTAESLEVARKYCDVVSHNIYGRASRLLSRSESITKLDVPVLIGEFHFGALDRGMFHTGLGPVESQEERGEQYAEYIRTALEQPWCVGAHWFIYVDQALTGRSDGENYNIGFVNGTDTPYPELVSAATKANFAIYQQRGR